jgi:26S proteasome regulatory subunit N9
VQPRNVEVRLDVFALWEFTNDVSIDSQERLSFLTAVANKVNNPNSQDAYVYATVAVATVKLELKDLEGARKDLDKSEKILDGFDSVETIVHAAFYRVNAEYYQVCLLTKVEE